MKFLGKPIERLTNDDLAQIEEIKPPESLTVEYKRDLPGKNDNERKEFLADVSAFANTAGGVIVYGIEESKDEDGQNTGTPGRIVGIGNVTAEQEKQRLEAIIRDGLDPRLTNVKFEFREIDKKPLLLLGIRRSLLSPHMVWLGKSGKFYKRSSAGRYQLDASELRGAFLETEEWDKQAERFRRERIMNVRSGDWMPNLDIDGSYFMHVLPLGKREEIDLVEHESELNLKFPPPFVNGWNHRFNLDGIMMENRDKVMRSYVQFFRNGGMEAYSSTVLLKNESAKPLDVHAGRAETMAIKYLKQYFAFASTMGVEPPVIVYLSLFGMKGGRIVDANNVWFPEDVHPFVQDEIIFPGILVNSFEDDPEVLFRPTFNMLWQAIGCSKSRYNRQKTA